MKKILLGAVIACNLLMATEDTNTTKAMSIQETMHHLEVSVHMIQKGFLYNSKGMVEEGTKQLKVALNNKEAFVIKDPKEQKNKNFDAQKYAQNESKALLGLADKVIEHFEKGEMGEAVENYDHIVSRCYSCHRIIRKW